MSVETVLCIPGLWKDRTDFLESVVRDSDGYMFAGQVLLHLESKNPFELYLEEYDPRMSDAFRAAGYHWMDTPEMALIEQHRLVAYLVAEGGSHEKANAIMDAGNALIKAGGLGVKVESTGLAHSPSAWAEACELKAAFTAHGCFVLYVTGNQVYSCGMHNLGLPDCIVDPGDSDNPSELLRSFSYYLFTEAPTLKEGETFGVSENSPVYRISKHPCIDYGEDSLFNNPFGMWKLTLCS